MPRTRLADDGGLSVVWQFGDEVEGPDGHAFPHIEAVGVGTVNRGIEIEQTAAGGPGAAFEFGEEGSPDTRGAGAGGYHEIIDGQLSRAEGGRHDPPPGDGDADIIDICTRETQTLLMALGIDGPEGFGGQPRSQFTEDGEYIRDEQRVIKVNVGEPRHPRFILHPAITSSPRVSWVRI